jgi:hypothetical protein
MGGIMCDGRQKGGPMGEHGTSGPPCRIDMAMPIGGPGIRLQKNMGGGGGAKPTLSVPAPSARCVTLPRAPCNACSIA